jgi:hypothetical protein
VDWTLKKTAQSEGQGQGRKALSRFDRGDELPGSAHHQSNLRLGQTVLNSTSLQRVDWDVCPAEAATFQVARAHI